jgi:hypothetical protein
VDNYFTDPQIHSHDGASFGMGNLGQEGMEKFLSTHKCNSICRLMGLVPPEREADGTWKVGKDSVATSRITKQSFKSDSSESVSAWTARKYNSAMTEAITRVTKKRSKDQEEEVGPTVALTQQQLAQLQAKLMMLIQQHGRVCVSRACAQRFVMCNTCNTCLRTRRRGARHGVTNAATPKQAA